MPVRVWCKGVIVDKVELVGRTGVEATGSTLMGSELSTPSIAGTGMVLMGPRNSGTILRFCRRMCELVEDSGAIFLDVIKLASFILMSVHAWLIRLSSSPISFGWLT